MIDIANLQQELNEKGFVDIAHGLTIFYEPESHKYRLQETEWSRLATTH